jgi:integrase
MIGYSMRLILRTLWEHHGAPKLDKHVPRYGRVHPRNVTATREEIDAILGAAKDSLRLWLLLCSDLAIRSGTANRLNGDNYDPHSGILRFTSKHHSAQTMPVTDEIKRLLAPLDHHARTPYVWQLRAAERTIGGHNVSSMKRQQLDRDFKAVRLSVGITRRITPHDLRRTTAVAVLEHTRDIRVVKDLLGHSDLKNTLWYIDHDLNPVTRSMLELVKSPNWRKERTA